MNTGSISAFLASDAEGDKKLQLMGDTELHLQSAFQIFLMQAGFCTLEAGVVRDKNVKSIIIKNFLDTSVGAVTWWLVGFGLQAGEGNCFVGETYFVGDALDDTVLLVGGIQWEGYSYWLWTYCFMTTSLTIVSGIVSERIRPLVYALFAVYFGAVIYPVLARSVWHAQGLFMGGCGDASLRRVIDFAGAGAVHLAGGVAGLTGAMLLGPRAGRFDTRGHPVQLGSPNPTLHALGVFVLWFGFYSFNVSSAGTTSNPALNGLIAINSTICPCLACLTVMLLSARHKGYVDLQLVMNSALAGLVCSTAMCATAVPKAAALAGVLSGAAYYGASHLMLRLRIDDPVDGIAVHGVSGALGLLLAAPLSSRDLLWRAGVLAEAAPYERGYQCWIQLLACLWVAAYSGGGSLVCFQVLNKAIWMFGGGRSIRIDPMEELRGIDEGLGSVTGSEPRMSFLSSAVTRESFSGRPERLSFTGRPERLSFTGRPLGGLERLSSGGLERLNSLVDPGSAALLGPGGLQGLHHALGMVLTPASSRKFRMARGEPPAAEGEGQSEEGSVVSEYHVASHAANEPMEDAWWVETRVLGGAAAGVEQLYIGVFDGHYGASAAAFCKDHMHQLVYRAVRKCGGDVERALVTAFKTCDYQWLESIQMDYDAGDQYLALVGCCALVALIHGHHLYVANAGDSQAVLAYLDGKQQLAVKELNSRHNLQSEREVQKLLAAHPNDPSILGEGGRSRRASGVLRVKGEVTVTRALGNARLKKADFNGPNLVGRFRITEPYNPPYISAEPEVTRHELSSSDQFLLAGSDGLWDHVDPHEAAAFVYNLIEVEELENIAGKLVSRALTAAVRKQGMTIETLMRKSKWERRKIHDDITIVIVFFNRETVSSASSSDGSVYNMRGSGI